MIAALFLPFFLAGPTPSVAVAPQDPPIEIWINNDRQFSPGDPVNVQVRTRDDGYLVVLNADPDGNVRVLFPINPDDDNFVRGGKRYDVKGRGDRQTFEANATGRGTVYAAVSPTRFQFQQFTTGNHWSEHALAPQRLSHEPESELTALVQSMAGESFDYDILSYDVTERHYASDSYAPMYGGNPYGGYPYGYGYPYAYPYAYPFPYSSFYGCDPFFPSYTCGPFIGSSFSLAFGFGTSSFVSPFFFQPVFVHRQRFNSAVFINNRFVFHDRFFATPGHVPGRFNPGLGGDFRDRRFSGSTQGFNRSFMGTPRRGGGTPVQPMPRGPGFEGHGGRSGGRRADIPDRSTSPDRDARGVPVDRSLGERRGIEARRARPGRDDVDRPNGDRPASDRPAADRPTGDRRSNDRVSEPRRVEPRDDATPARPSERPTAQPRRSDVERQPMPESRSATPRRSEVERQPVPESRSVTPRRSEVERQPVPESRDVTPRRSEVERQPMPKSRDVTPRRSEVERQPMPESRDVTPRRAEVERGAPDRGQSVERRGNMGGGRESRGMGASRSESRGGMRGDNGGMRGGGGGGGGNGGGGGRRR